MSRRFISGWLVIGMALAVQGAESVVRVCADRVTCRYALGEVANLSVSLVDEKGDLLRRGRVAWSVDNFGPVVSQTNTVVDLAEGNPFSVSVTRATPGFARLLVVSGDSELKIRTNAGNHLDGYAYGIVFDPSHIRSGTPDPEDFDVFWKQAVDTLDAEVPPDIRLDPMPDLATQSMNCFRISVASADGRRVYGWLTEPKDLSAGPYPVRIRVPGAGIGFTGPVFCDGAICLSMNVHSYAQPEGGDAAAVAERQRLYDEQDRVFAAPRGVKRYCQAGIHLGREQYFYYASILGVNRAVNWLAQRPECDLRDFTYSGTSQGGGFGLYLTALNRHITRSVICVPALTDLLGSRVEGRQSGWPQIVEAQRSENRAAAERWAPYFCGVNFARRITVPIRFVVGFSDCVCSPNAVLSAFNACSSEDKVLFDGIGMGHRVYDDFYGYLDAWERSGSAAASKYRFLAFNIWGDYFANPPHERDACEADLIRRWNPDFVALQEVTPNFWKSRLISQLKEEYVVVGRGMGPGGIDSYVPVAFRCSRFKLLESGAEGFCPEIDTSKGVVWAVVEDRTSGRRLVVFSSHFWWQKKGVADDWVRLDNARRLSARMHEIADRHDADIIGGGDLNAPVESWAMRHLISDGLADAQQKADFSPRMVRTHHVNPVRDAKGVYYGVPAVRGISEKVSWLDHIFYDPKRIRALKFGIDMSAEACSLSDHHPIYVDFE